MYGYTKGYTRGTLTQDISYSHETDASSSAVITADLTGSTVYCVSGTA